MCTVRRTEDDGVLPGQCVQSEEEEEEEEEEEDSYLLQTELMV